VPLNNLLAKRATSDILALVIPMGISHAALLQEWQRPSIIGQAT